MTPGDYDFLRKLLKERSGLVLNGDKQYLIESRLLPVSRRAGVAGLDGLIGKIRQPGNEQLVVEVVEAMATNESLFFRDKIPFEHFSETILPALLASRANQRRIRIWCAAASTGQEPYSLAMALKEMVPVAPNTKTRLRDGASISWRPTSRSVCWKKPGPASTANSKCSADCRFRCW